MENLEIKHVYGGSPEPYKVKVEKNTKGYNWEISLAGNDPLTIIDQIKAIDSLLRKEFMEDEPRATLP